MSDIYVRTETYVSNDAVVTLTPYCDFHMENTFMTVMWVADTTILHDSFRDLDTIPISKAQMCIELDGELYAWKE